MDPGPWTLDPGPWTMYPVPCTLYHVQVANASTSGLNVLHAKLQQQRKVEAALKKTKEELRAAGAALEMQNQPAVQPPTVPVSRARKDAPNKYGCVVGRSESDAATFQAQKEKADAAQAKVTQGLHMCMHMIHTCMHIHMHP